LQQLFPAQRPVVDPLSIYDEVEFPELPERAYLYLNMVSSVDGRAQVNGRAVGLGSPTDQALMRRLRALADCVVNASGTVAADNVYEPLAPELVEARLRRGQAEEPLWAVATGSGNVREDAPMFQRARRRAVVFAAERTPVERRRRLAELADVVVAGDEEPEPPEVLRLLRTRYGCRRALSEGGPTFNAAVLRADVLDELFLTFAPKLVAGQGKTIVDGPQFPFKQWPLLELVTLYEQASELFFRYRVRHGARESGGRG